MSDNPTLICFEQTNRAPSEHFWRRGCEPRTVRRDSAGQSHRGLGFNWTPNLNITRELGMRREEHVL
jgi:hypothetical protein